MNNKIIITLNNEEEKEKYEALGITKFAYPLEDFCVGIPHPFSYSKIPKDAYLFLNRILDNDGIDKLKNILKKIKIHGIIFDDLGVLELIKDMDIEKILFLSHFNSNKESIRIYLKYVDSVIISTDITEKEIRNINDEFQEQLTLFTLGYVSAMYSRRLLIDNYTKFYHLEKNNPIIIEENNQKFLLYENPYGTVFYHMPIFNGLRLMNIKAKYYFIYSAFMSYEEIHNLLNSKDIANVANIAFDDGFLNKETIYKLKGDMHD